MRDFVPTKFSVSGLEPERAAEIAAWAVEHGFRTMKVKVGIEPEGDVARVRAVRAAIGPDVRLGVDANGGWATRIAIRTIRRLEEFGIYFAEQPVPALDVTWLADVRAHVDVPVMADESVYTLQDAMAVVRAGAADVLSVYIGKGGGIGPARKVAAVAEAAGLTCTVGSNLEIGVASAAMIHLAMATPASAPRSSPATSSAPSSTRTTSSPNRCRSPPAAPARTRSRGSAWSWTRGWWRGIGWDKLQPLRVDWLPTTQPGRQDSTYTDLVEP